MNRTIKDATVRTFHSASAETLKQHLHAFLLAYTCARRLKTLKGSTPYDFICRQWTVEPKRFKLNPYHHSPGLGIQSRRVVIRIIKRHGIGYGTGSTRLRPHDRGGASHDPA